MSKRRGLRNKSIYFDTNAILDMSQPERRSDIAREQVRRLERLVAQRKLIVYVSGYQIEELLAPLVSPHPQVSLERVEKDLRFCRDIACRDGLIESPGEILATDMQRCLSDEGAVSHLLHTEEVWERLDAALGCKTESDFFSLLDAVRRSRAKTDGFKKLYDGLGDDFRQRYAEMIASTEKESTSSEEEIAPIEEQVWDAVTANLVTDWAARSGVAKHLDDSQVCHLLSVKSVRLAVGYQASYMYELWFLKNRRAAKGDYQDQMHVMSASVADVFVTGDERLVRILNRIPDRGIDVLSLPDLLSQL